jgi:plasmid stabilization system protein ParE
MSTVTVPASAAEALGMLKSAMGFLADADAAQMPAAALVHCLRVTRGQAAGHQAVQALARGHRPLLAGLRAGHVLTTSVALQLAKWTRSIPAEFREQAEEILVTAARAGADERALARIAAEIRYRTAPPDPDDERARPEEQAPLPLA